MNWPLVRMLSAGAIFGAAVAARGDFPVSVTQPAPQPPPPATGSLANTAETARIYTIDELKAALRDQQYRTILQQVSRIQPNKRLLAEYNPYDLTMLKAEAYVGLRMNTQAIDSFTQAARIAPDAKAQAVPMATALLVKRSQNLLYTVKHPAPLAAGVAPKPGTQSLDLTRLEQRPDALAALYADELFEVRSNITAAERGTALPPIAQAGKRLDDLALLELAATGQNTNATRERTTLATHARDLIKVSLDRMGPMVATISKNAEHFVELDYPVTDAKGRVITYERHYRKRGLLNNEPQIIQDIKTSADKIETAMGELGTLLQQNAEFFAAITADARKISVQANTLLQTDYSAIDPPGSPNSRR